MVRRSTRLRLKNSGYASPASFPAQRERTPSEQNKLLRKVAQPTRAPADNFSADLLLLRPRSKAARNRNTATIPAPAPRRKPGTQADAGEAKAQTDCDATCARSSHTWRRWVK